MSVTIIKEAQSNLQKSLIYGGAGVARELIRRHLADLYKTSETNKENK